MKYSIMGKMRVLLIDSDLIYRGTLKGRFDCINITDIMLTKFYVYNKDIKQ